jgi:drug/metabolite transporter (DMT)-like permease
LKKHFSQKQTGHAAFADRRFIGLVQIVTAAVGYGLLGIFGKRAYEAGMQPGDLLALRFLLASAVLWSYMLIAKRSALRITFRQAAYSIALGVLGYALFSTLYFEALKGLSVSLTVLLLYTYPVIVMIGSWLLFKERVTRGQVIALLMVCVGLVALLSSNVAVVKGSAIALALASAVMYAAYILASGRLVASLNPLTAGLYIMTAAAVALIVRAPTALWQVDKLSFAAWTAVIALALISTVGPMVLFLMGLEKISGTEASLLSTMEPVTATIAAAFVLGESLSPLQLLGGGLVLAALVVSSLSRQSSQIKLEIIHRTAQ